MRWQTYLKTASVALFGTKQHTDNPPQRSDTLNRLKKTMKLILFDAAYFKKPEYIAKDLKNFAGV